MITEERIISLVEQVTEGTGIFLVEVLVKPGNTIRVHVDTSEGISIDQCVRISRFLNEQLDRDTEDFSLEVSSPGVGTPFRVMQQYEKNCGRKVEVTLNDGKRLEGKLEGVEGEEITLNVKGMEQVVLLSDIKKTKAIISFN